MLEWYILSKSFQLSDFNLFFRTPDEEGEGEEEEEEEEETWVVKEKVEESKVKEKS